MVETDNLDTTYSDGKIYVYSATLTTGIDYTYYFEAYDIWDSTATGVPIAEQNGPIISESNNTPILEWTNEANYSTNGIYPLTGMYNTTFVYRIKYGDSDNDAPESGYPKLHIKKNGQEISNSPFSMSAIDNNDTTYTDGKIYSYSTTLAGGSDYCSYFEAYDVKGSSATGQPVIEQDAPDIPLYYIKGYIKNSSGIPLNDVLVTLSGPTSSNTHSDNNGYFELLTLSAGGDYTVTPTLKDHIFYPLLRSYNAMSSNQNDQMFNYYGIDSGDVKVQVTNKNYINPNKNESLYIIIAPRETGTVHIKLYNIVGELIWEAVKDVTYNTQDSTKWSGRNNSGQTVASGIYLLFVDGAGCSYKTKIAVVK